jgi:dihydropteroate synthase
MNINIRGELYSLESPKVMGILNLTPDSFYDGGKFSSEKKILTHVVSMLENGMDILDVGGYSSRPGAKNISVQEEEKRVIPILKYLRKEFKDLIISVDTFRSEIARKSIENGADIINDISAGEIDEEIMNVVSEYNIPYVIMHMKGDPQTMQKNVNYDDVCREIISYLAQRIKKAREYKINDLIIDPGFGFGKTLKNNYEILSNLHHFEMIDLPLLVGFSRKSMITKALEIEKEFALNGTSILNTIALMKGAKILRVHDVKEAKECINLYNLTTNNSGNS